MYKEGQGINEIPENRREEIAAQKGYLHLCIGPELIFSLEDHTNDLMSSLFKNMLELQPLWNNQKENTF